MTHSDFILAAYGAAILVLAAVVLWIVLDYRALRGALDALERQGVTRRSRPKAKKRS